MRALLFVGVLFTWAILLLGSVVLAGVLVYLVSGKGYGWRTKSRRSLGAALIGSAVFVGAAVTVLLLPVSGPALLADPLVVGPAFAFCLLALAAGILLRSENI